MKWGGRSEMKRTGNRVAGGGTGRGVSVARGNRGERGGWEGGDNGV